MSDGIPEFKHGDRIMAMQVPSNEAIGIDGVCGVVLSIKNSFSVKCFFENGKANELG